MIEFAVVMLVIFLFITGLSYGEEIMKRLVPSRREDPERVLAARFARGEIDEKEYSRRLSVLRLGPPLEIE